MDPHSVQLYIQNMFLNIVDVGLIISNFVQILNFIIDFSIKIIFQQDQNNIDINLIRHFQFIHFQF